MPRTVIHVTYTVVTPSRKTKFAKLSGSVMWDVAILWQLRGLYTSRTFFFSRKSPAVTWRYDRDRSVSRLVRAPGHKAIFAKWPGLGCGYPVAGSMWELRGLTMHTLQLRGLRANIVLSSFFLFFCFTVQQSPYRPRNCYVYTPLLPRERHVPHCFAKIAFRDSYGTALQWH